MSAVRKATRSRSLAWLKRFLKCGRPFRLCRHPGTTVGILKMPALISLDARRMIWTNLGTCTHQ